MRKVRVYESISVDGYFTDAHGDMSWAHRSDPEWNAFTAENASGGATLLLGRITYDLMRGFWSTAAARESNAKVAEGMNEMQKVVFSRTMKVASWRNTLLVHDDLPGTVRRMKGEAGPDLVILGSGTIVAQLTAARLIDEYQFVLSPIVLGGGRTPFEGIPGRLQLVRHATRAFTNGNIVTWYRPGA